MRLVVTEFMSLDGVVEDPGGAEDFEHGGWSFEFNRGDDGDKFKLDETMESEAVLLGRTTYEGFAAAWPEREGEFADKFNTMPKYVVSSTMDEAEWQNSTVIRPDDLVAEVTRLKEKPGGMMQVPGSVQLARALGDAGLVDEYRIMLFPVVLGSGKRLFEDVDRSNLKLTESKQVGDGVMILIYEPVS
jgi:dihydrofolate reductase